MCVPEVDKDDMKKTLETVIKSSGLETEIRNIVYHLVRSNGKVETKPTGTSHTVWFCLNCFQCVGQINEIFFYRILLVIAVIIGSPVVFSFNIFLL